MAFRQLTLDIRPEQQPGFDNFVEGSNGELLARLRALAEPDRFDLIYLWGPPGSGRSHLLRAARRAARRPTALVRGAEAGDDLGLAPGGLLIVDDVDRLSGTAQIALFRAFNSARPIGLALLMSGPVPPLQLALREDLRTRIGAALIYEVKPLTDEDKAAILRQHARARGMRVEDDIIRYLLRHAPRDLPTLMALLDALDRVSLEQQRQVTLPLLREVLQDLPAQS
ncbi:MAG: DnaA regulatory inactivator Hda [Pseudomonadota bacterium]|jgi:DnaA family protein